MHPRQVLPHCLVSVGLRASSRESSEGASDHSIRKNLLKSFDHDFPEPDKRARRDRYHFHGKGSTLKDNRHSFDRENLGERPREELLRNLSTSFDLQ